MCTLEVVRAGAGSGKTTDLCRTVADAVGQGLDPARVLATTFTKKAAAELKGRIQAKLLDEHPDAATRHQVADRLDLASIGTVHSVAHRLLSRYAIDLGMSPRLEIIEEAASKRDLRDLLGAIPAGSWEPLAACAARLAIDDADLHQRILSLLAAKRGNRISDDDFTAQMAASADRLCAIISPTGVLAVATPIAQLYDLADQALTNIIALNDTQKNTAEGMRKLRQLKSKPLWGAHVDAMRITAGKKTGADALLNALRNHASRVRENPQLHGDIRDFSARIATETVRLASEYSRYKAARGLVDFTDLEILFLGLLENERLAAQLAADFELILVDEFQDTNPLQLAIFQRLRSLTARSRWVGDPKQAIYGFRDTDPELVNNIWHNAPAASRTELPNNHRSQRGLVQLVGALFAPVFGADARQEPQKLRRDRGVERWVLDTRNQGDDAVAIACGVARLHEEGNRFGDICILVRANYVLPTLAEALGSLGIPSLLDSPGLLSTCEGALVMAGLHLAVDRHDSLAAATVVHLLGDPTEDTPAWVTERMQALRAAAQAPWAEDHRFARLDGIDRTLSSPTLIMQQVIEALDLPSRVQQWGDPGRRCSNLDSLLRHAREYEEMAFDAGQAATLTGLILYLKQLADESADMRYPPLGHDAVTLLTYHSAKGLEWPVVILSGLDSGKAPNMWAPVVKGGGEVDNPLQGRVLRSWTWPFGMTEGDFPQRRTGSGLDDDALTSPEGQERADRETQENLRLLYVGCTRAKEKLVFAHREDQCQWLHQLPDVDTILDCGRDDGEYALDGIETTFVIRHLNPSMADECRVEPRTRERWLSLAATAVPPDSVPRYHAPSQQTGDGADAVTGVTEMPGPSHFPAAHEGQYTVLGDAVHSYLASLPSTRPLSNKGREVVAERCLAAFGVAGLLSPAAVVAMGERFCDWMQRTYPDAVWQTEVTMTAPRAADGQWFGTGDLLLHLTGGGTVIIDHKSTPIRREHCRAKAATFAAQIHGYQEILAKAGEDVRAAFIHFPLVGVIAEMRLV